jgi:hypothetical protein
VTLLSASMGGPFVALFCADYVTEEWKAANIFSFVSISGVYGGSTSPLNTLLSGRWGGRVSGRPLIFSRLCLYLACMGAPLRR